MSFDETRKLIFPISIKAGEQRDSLICLRRRNIFSWLAIETRKETREIMPRIESTAEIERNNVQYLWVVFKNLDISFY